MDDVRIFRGCLVADLVLPHARSLKDRRGPLRALLQRLRNHGHAVAQVGPSDLTQRAFLAVVAVSGSESQLTGLLDGAERILYASEFEVADLRRDVTSVSHPSL
ncbi:MAG: DUF503 domain-containing protein [Candidatus Krumholzibacteriia bacterium]